MQSLTKPTKKKPPPRPPPPDFSKYKSNNSTFNLNQQNQSVEVNLIDWSPPSSPKPVGIRNFGGSVSSSFSSSTSSLASSKRSFEFEPPVTNNPWPLQATPAPIYSPQTSHKGLTFQSYLTPAASQTSANIKSEPGAPSFFVPTIIRPKAKANSRLEDSCTMSETMSNPPSPPMPDCPPPSLPEGVASSYEQPPYGFALYDFPATYPGDLALQKDDLILLYTRIDEEWLYGRVVDDHGTFPESYINTQVPLRGDSIAYALANFPGDKPGELPLFTGQKIFVTQKISDDWLFGKSQGKVGKFPSTLIDHMPSRFLKN